MDAPHQGPGNANGEPRPNQMVERADAQRAEADLGEPFVERVAQVERVIPIASLRGEDPDGGIVEALEREGEDPL